MTIGRWFMFTIVVVIGQELNYGLLLGIQDFVVYNVAALRPTAARGCRIRGPLGCRTTLTVESALLVSTLAAAVDPDGRNDAQRAEAWASAASTSGSACAPLWFGIRGQGATVANNVTARLDVTMLPAFVSSASVGLYSVAANVSLIVYQLANTFAGLVLPSAERRTRGAARPRSSSPSGRR